MMAAAWSTLILAAGRGTRLGGDTPKPLVRLGGRALVEPILTHAAHLTPGRTLVAISDATAAAHFADPRRQFVMTEPRGTGAAVADLPSAWRPSPPRRPNRRLPTRYVFACR